jgi:hypothetical protein
MAQAILVLNSGSSSIKFGVFDAAGDDSATIFRAAVAHLDDVPRLTVKDAGGQTVLDRTWPMAQSEETLISAVLEWLEKQHPVDGLVAVGHRIVHEGLRQTDLAERTEPGADRAAHAIGAPAPGALPVTGAHADAVAAGSSPGRLLRYSIPRKDRSACEPLSASTAI